MNGLWDHIDKLTAAVIAILGLVAVICGRDGFIVGIIGTALGFLFGVGVAKAKGG